MSKNSAKSEVRQLPKSIGKKEEKLQRFRRITYQELPQIFKRRYFLVPIFFILILAGFFILKIKFPLRTSNINVSGSSPSPQSTQEAKLIDVYKRETGVDLKNFVPRYSVYEDSGMGFKIAYPVGFTPISVSYGVRLSNTHNNGTIDIYAGNNSLQIKVNKEGLSQKEIDVLNTAADFIRSTYESTNPITYNKDLLQKRFSNGTGNAHF